MSTIRKLWSISGLSTEIGKDRRTVAAALQNVPPDGLLRDGNRAWHLTTALAAFNIEPVAREASDRLSRERARLARASADKIEMENAKRRGELLEAELVQATFEEELTKIRAACHQLPGMVATEMGRMGLGRAEQHRAAQAASQAVEDLFAILRDGARVVEAAASEQAGHTVEAREHQRHP